MQQLTYKKMSVNSGHIVAAIMTVFLLLVQQTTAASDEDGSCSVCDCLVNAMDTLDTLVDRRIEASLRRELLQLDECATGLHTCDDNADCTDTSGSFLCTCQPGYLGDGTTCTDINECDTGADNCDDNADCTNTDGGFTCQCRDGYQGDGETCTDVNECDTGYADCVQGAPCVNTEGSFTCSCPPGRNDTSGREGEGCFSAASIPVCGGGDWFRVISLDLRDPQQNCPTDWTEQTTPVRTCVSDLAPGCLTGFLETVDRPFTRVAGRAIGYQVGDTGAFSSTISNFNQDGINGFYLDGLSVTYTESGSPRNHIWSFASGLTDVPDMFFGGDQFRCPCLFSNVISPPTFVGDNYFCESGTTTTPTSGQPFFSADPLWDGEDCGGTCCDGIFSTVPWFCTTMDNAGVASGATIEVRNCHSANSENVAIELVEIFVQ